jgi:hypothetical protein
MTRAVILAALLCGLCAPRAARASCGFYVGASEQPRFDDATHVVLMRVGTRTVVSMQPHYRGPADAFALVVPVPASVQERDVRVLSPEVFDVVERIGAPRLVKYWERDPCSPDVEAAPTAPGAAPAREESREVTRDADASLDGAKSAAEVRVDARFAAGEYRISIVAASDAAAFDAWLRAEKYQLPASAEPLLAPYLARGMKLLVARVDPAKVHFDGDRAVLSPLRFHYDSERFELPIRIGLASSDGTQDLIVDILAPHQRYRVANDPNVTIPTNLSVDRAVRVQFAAFYNALFDATLERHPDAVITEYAWNATTCDPCPGPTLDRADFDTLGADVIDRANTSPAEDFVLTRLHLRYGKDVKEDLELVPAPPIAGGREHVGASGLFEQAAQPAPHDSFQARYVIRHPWLGPLRCANPVRGRWGAQDGGEAEFPAPPRRGRGALYRLPRSDLQPALGLAFAPRDAVVLAHALAQDVPAVDVSVADHGEMLAPAVPASTPGGEGGCNANASGSGVPLVLLFVAVRRRRRRLVD